MVPRNSVRIDQQQQHLPGGCVLVLYSDLIGDAFHVVLRHWMAIYRGP